MLNSSIELFVAPEMSLSGQAALWVMKALDFEKRMFMWNISGDIWSAEMVRPLDCFSKPGTHLLPTMQLEAINLSHVASSAVTKGIMLLYLHVQ